MVITNLDCILLGFLCKGFPCLLSTVVPNLNHMPFLLVEQFMDLLGQFLMFHLQVVGVLGLGEVIPVLQLAIISHTNKARSRLLGILDLHLISRL
jgi:hypothetical protein